MTEKPIRNFAKLAQLARPGKVLVSGPAGYDPMWSEGQCASGQIVAFNGNTFVGMNVSDAAEASGDPIVTASGGSIASGATLQVDGTISALPSGHIHVPLPMDADDATSKQYVDDSVQAILSASGGISQTYADLRYVNASGDTMSGALVQPVAPVASGDLTNKNYVDAGLSVKLDATASAGFSLVGHTHTSSEITDLASVIAASGFATTGYVASAVATASGNAQSLFALIDHAHSSGSIAASGFITASDVQASGFATTGYVASAVAVASANAAVSFMTADQGDSRYAQTASAETVTGLWDFSGVLPTSSVTPSAGIQLVNKSYTDSVVAASAITMSFADSRYPALASANTFTGANKFDETVIVGSSSNSGTEIIVWASANTGSNITFKKGVAAVNYWSAGIEAGFDDFVISDNINGNEALRIKGDNGLEHVIIDPQYSFISRPVVTALPNSGDVIDGDEVVLQTSDMATDEIAWHLRYRAGTNRWEFIGGAPWYKEVGTAENTNASASPVDLATTGPTFDQVLLPGKYIARANCTIANASATVTRGVVYLDNDGADEQLAQATLSGSNVYAHLSDEFDVLVANTTSQIKLQYLTTAATSAVQFSRRKLVVVPVYIDG